MAVSEAAVVTAITKKIIKEYPSAWIFKVVGSPFQMSGVPDLLVVVDGLMFGLEVKNPRPGESHAASVSRASPLQVVQIHRLREAGAVADVVTSPAEALALIEARLAVRDEKEIAVTEYEVATDPKAGDIATHSSGTLDDRKVARVEGDQIWLSLHGPEIHIGPFPVYNYTFARAKKAGDDEKIKGRVDAAPDAG